MDRRMDVARDTAERHCQTKVTVAIHTVANVIVIILTDSVAPVVLFALSVSAGWQTASVWTISVLLVESSRMRPIHLRWTDGSLYPQGLVESWTHGQETQADFM